MINLKENFVCIEDSCYGRECPDTHKVINLRQYNDAVAFYLDAKDNIDKYPELKKEFEKAIIKNIGKNNLKYVKSTEFMYKLNYANWLFKKIFEGED